MTCIYFILEILMLILGFLSYKISSKQARCLFALVCILWTIVFGLRAYTVGNDTPGYAEFFMGKDSFYGNIKDSNLEFGFLLITKLIKVFTNSPTAYFSILASWLFLLIYKIYTRCCLQRDCFWCLLIVFTISNSFVTLMVATRQSMAFCVLLTGLYIALNKKLEKKMKLKVGLSLIVLSVFVHKSIIFLLFLLFVAYYVHLSKKQMYVMIGASFVISIFFLQDIGNLFNHIFIFSGTLGINDINENIMATYASSFGDFKQNFITLVAWAAPICLTIYLSDYEYVNSFMFRVMVISVCVFLLFNTTFLIERINTLLVLLGFTQYFPHNKKCNLKKFRPIYLLFILLILFKAGLRYEHWPKMDSSLPYYFYFEK